jgi:hypothetical protein
MMQVFIDKAIRLFADFRGKVMAAIGIANL